MTPNHVLKRDEIFKEFNIDDSHDVWEPMIDNWFSVEAFRQQTGRLPEAKDDSIGVAIDFLRNKVLHSKLIGDNPLQFGSMYLSSKRLLRRHMK